jgi:hypothetical protein
MTDAGIVHVSDPVSWDEITRRFPSQWIMLVAIDWTDDDGREIQTAFVAGCGATRRAARAMARPLLGVFHKVGCFHTRELVPALPPIVYATTDHAPARTQPAPAPSGVFAFA